MQISQVSPGTQGSIMPSDAGVQRPTVTDAAKTASAALEMPAKAVESTKQAVDPSQVKTAMEKINQTVRMMSSNLEFTQDAETGIDVVKVIDSENKQLIRQFPSEEVIAIARALDQLQGMLVKDKA